MLVVDMSKSMEETDMKRDRIARDLMLHAHPLRVDDAQRQVAGLELGERTLRTVRRPPQSERFAVEGDRCVEVMGRHRDKVNAGDELVLAY